MFDSALMSNRKEEKKASSDRPSREQRPAPKANTTGIPTPMKNNFEQISGLSFDDVRVHYNSDKPAQLQALAYTQGNQVFIAPGQERHLGHELGHVVQQKSGLVKPTATVGGLALNDDASLERMADSIGRGTQAVSGGSVQSEPIVQRTPEEDAAALEYLGGQGVPKDDANRIISSFVLAKDIEPISKTTKSQSAAVSIRETGALSLNMLSRGAGAKGHEILEKTIKAKSMGVTSGTTEELSIQKGLSDQGLPPQIAGLVANWDGTKIKGLYLTQNGVEFFSAYKLDASQSKSTFSIIAGEKTKILDLQDEKSKSAFCSFISGAKDWEKYFFTGDYDMHDMISFAGHKNIVPSDSPDEKSLISKLNDSMKKEGEPPDDDYKRIRHGAQVNYIAHNLDKEPREKILKAVAGLSLPVAMCSKGVWELIKEDKDLRSWYHRNSVKIKATWDDTLEGREQFLEIVYRVKAIARGVSALWSTKSGVGNQAENQANMEKILSAFKTLKTIIGIEMDKNNMSDSRLVSDFLKKAVCEKLDEKDEKYGKREKVFDDLAVITGTIAKSEPPAASETKPATPAAPG